MCYTLIPSVTIFHFTGLNLRQIYVFHWFQNPHDITNADLNVSFHQGGDQPATLGDLATTENKPQGKGIMLQQNSLNFFYMKFFFGGFIILGGEGGLRYYPH